VEKLIQCNLLQKALLILSQSGVSLHIKNVTNFAMKSIILLKWQLREVITFFVAEKILLVVFEVAKLYKKVAVKTQQYFLLK
jgi:hypothetical protein